MKYIFLKKLKERAQDIYLSLGILFCTESFEEVERLWSTETFRPNKYIEVHYLFTLDE